MRVWGGGGRPKKRGSLGRVHPRDNGAQPFIRSGLVQSR